MDLETLFTGSKWEILKKISNKPMSPLQLSTKLSTTIANISQQMRLLEVAGLLSKEKISTRESGKPRTLFGIDHDFAHVILVGKEGAKKELLAAPMQKRILLNAWFTNDEDVEKMSLGLVLFLGNEVEALAAVARNRNKKELLISAEDLSKHKKALDDVAKICIETKHKLRIIKPREFSSLVKGLDPKDFAATFDLLLIDDKLFEEMGKEV